MEERKWHYDNNNRPKGPLTIAEMAERIDEGVINAQTLVWAYPMKDWAPAANVEVFTRYFGQGQEGLAYADHTIDDYIPYVPPGAGYVYVSQVQPWARLFARHLDYLGISFIAMIIALLTFADPFTILGMTVVNMIAVSIALDLIWVPIEALLINIYGTTPGKYLLGIRVTDTSGQNPDFGRALKRSFLVWGKGMGLTLPLIGTITQILGYTNLTRHHISSWDKSSGTTVEHHDYKMLSPILYFLVIMALTFLVTVLVLING